MNGKAIPTWQSECARPHQRGFLITLSGALISGGIMIAYWVDYGFYFLKGTIRWRFPVAFQSFFSVLTQISPAFETFGWKILVANQPGTKVVC